MTLARPLFLTLAAASLLGAALTAPAGAATRACGAFDSQADAQTYFIANGGGPRERVGRLDRDRNGVACDGKEGPYVGFANIGYNKRERFFYGYAWMPVDATDPSGHACLYGNRRFPDGPRMLTVYRVNRHGGDKPLRRFRETPAHAEPSRGRLVWKMKALRPHGRYYVAFEHRIPISPYGPVECPDFRSRAIAVSAGDK